MDKVWVLIGSTGEYADYVEWMVCAYRSEATANVARIAAERAVTATHQTDLYLAHGTSFDPSARDYGGGTHYEIRKVMLAD